MTTLCVRAKLILSCYDSTLFQIHMRSGPDMLAAQAATAHSGSTGAAGHQVTTGQEDGVDTPLSTQATRALLTQALVRLLQSPEARLEVFAVGSWHRRRGRARWSGGRRRELSGHGRPGGDGGSRAGRGVLGVRSCLAPLCCFQGLSVDHHLVYKTWRRRRDVAGLNICQS